MQRFRQAPKPIHEAHTNQFPPRNPKAVVPNVIKQKHAIHRFGLPEKKEVRSVFPEPNPSLNLSTSVDIAPSHWIQAPKHLVIVSICIGTPFLSILRDTLQSYKQQELSWTLYLGIHEKEREEVTDIVETVFQRHPDTIKLHAFTDVDLHHDQAKFDKGCLVRTLQQQVVIDFPQLPKYILIVDIDILLPKLNLDNVEFSCIYAPKRMKTYLTKESYDAKEKWIDETKNQKWRSGAFQLICGDFAINETEFSYTYLYCHSKNASCCDQEFLSLYRPQQRKELDIEIIHVGIPQLYWDGVA